MATNFANNGTATVKPEAVDKKPVEMKKSFRESIQAIFLDDRSGKLLFPVDFPAGLLSKFFLRQRLRAWWKMESNSKFIERGIDEDYH